MAKKRVAHKTGGAAQPGSSDAAADPVTAAAAAVDHARSALREAQQAYDQACSAAAEQAVQTRSVTLGDILDGTLEFVRRHPAAGLLSAGVIGFLIGRIRGR